MNFEFIAREENFGYTIYNPKEFNHFFLKKEEFEKFSKQNLVELKETPNKTSRLDIIYSPIRVYYETTLACNLRCKTCLNSSGNKENDELTLEDSINTIKGLANDGIFDIKFTGGEFILKLGWDILLESARKSGLTSSINTNALFNRIIADKLIEHNPEEIAVSLDGYMENNDWIRGEGSYKKAINNMEYMSQAGLNLTINTVVTRMMGEDDIKKLIEVANLYCKDISFFHPRPIGRAREFPGMILSYNELDVFMKKIEELKKVYSDSSKILTRSQNIRKNIIGSKNATEFGLMNGGTDGFTRFNLTPNGDIFAGGCVPYISNTIREQVKLGNILEENFSILNIWRKSPKLNEIRKMSSSLQNRCDSCFEYKSSCSGFSLEMELNRELDNGKNIYCVY